MGIEVRCTKCGRKYVVQPTAERRQVRCRACGNVFRVDAPTDPKSNRPAPAAPSATDYKYAAFISYRHVDPDRAWAKWLHAALETYRIPKRIAQQRQGDRSNRLGRVFRDEEELAASSDLSREIDTALEQSKFLIVVCSPRTPGSEWVNREVERFRELGRHDQILSLLIEGDPSTSFPRALVAIRKSVTEVATGLEVEWTEDVEPLAADARTDGRRSHGGVKRSAKLRLLAQMLGVRFDELRQREQERRTRVLTAIGGMLVILVVLMGGLTAFALRQKSVAEQQTSRAVVAEGEARQREGEAQAGRKQIAEQLEREQSLTQQLSASVRAEKEQRAQQLVSTADAMARSGDVYLSRQTYRQAWDLSRELKVAELPAIAGLTASYAVSPPPVATFDLNHQDDKPIERSVEYVEFLPDGRRAIAAWNQELICLDLITGRALHRMNVKSRVNNATLVSSTSATVRALTGGADGFVRVWDVEAGRELAAFDLKLGPIDCLAVTPDAKRFACGVGRGLVVCDLDTGKVILTHTMPNNLPAKSLAFSADGRTALAGNKGRLQLWNPETGGLIRELAKGDLSVYSASFVDSSRAVLHSGADKTALLVELEAARVLKRFGRHRSAVFVSAMTPNGKFVVTGSDDATLKVWDANTAFEVHSLHGHAAAVRALAISRDGKRALSGSIDSTVCLWNLPSEARDPSFSDGTATTWAVAISPDGRLILTADGNRWLNVWDAATGKLLARHRVQHAIRSLHVQPDGRRVTACDDNSFSVWDYIDGKEMRFIRGPTLYGWRTRMSADGLFGASCVRENEQQVVRAWSLLDGQPLSVATTPNDVRMLVPFAKGTRGMRVIGNGDLRVCDLASGKMSHAIPARALGSVIVVVPSPDESLVATASTDGSDTSISLWELATGKLRHRLKGHASYVDQVAFSPDGRFLLSGGYDSSVRLWDIHDGRQLQLFEGHRGRVRGIAFGLDARSAVSASEPDNIVRVWNFARSGEMRSLEERYRQAMRVGSEVNSKNLAVFSEWFAFHGMDDWAVELFERARQIDPVAQHVSDLTIARCYWRLGRKTDAEAAFQTALAKREAPEPYLRMLIEAVSNGPRTNDAR